MKYDYKKWTMQIDEGEEILLYNGKEFQNFEELAKVCGCEEIEIDGKKFYGDNDTYIDVNDYVMDGVTENLPGQWNEQLNIWSWGMFINDNYVTFRYYI
jgi:hypothetical protein